MNAARASFGKESDWDISGYEEVVNEESRVVEHHPVKVLKEKDVRLIDYLAREKHVLPFRPPQITLRCKAPIFLCRQLGKHQVGMSWSEESRRYITDDVEVYTPDVWRGKADNVKQGSSDEEIIEAHAVNTVVVGKALEGYKELLRLGVAPEMARMILPQSAITTWVWTGSLRSFYQLYPLRAEAHAQREAQYFAEMIKVEVSKLYPESWAALERHV